MPGEDQLDCALSHSVHAEPGPVRACLSSPRTQKGASSKHPPMSPLPPWAWGVWGSGSPLHIHTLKRPLDHLACDQQKTASVFQPLRLRRFSHACVFWVTFFPPRIGWRRKRSNMCLQAFSQNFRKSKQCLVWKQRDKSEIKYPKSQALKTTTQSGETKPFIIDFIFICIFLLGRELGR